MSLDLRANLVGFAPTGSAFGERVDLPICSADLWLFSNLPALRHVPFRLTLDPGITFQDAQAPASDFHRPLIGMGALLRAGLKVQIDFARATVSIWTPGSWPENVTLLWRRLLSGRSTLPPLW